MTNRAAAGPINMFVLIESGLANHHMTSEHAEPPARPNETISQAPEPLGGAPGARGLDRSARPGEMAGKPSNSIQSQLRGSMRLMLQLLSLPNLSGRVRCVLTPSCGEKLRIAEDRRHRCKNEPRAKQIRSVAFGKIASIVWRS